MSPYKLLATPLFALALIGCIRKVEIIASTNTTYVADPSCAVIIKAQKRMLLQLGTRGYDALPDSSGEMNTEKLSSVLTSDAYYYKTDWGWKKIDRDVWAAHGAAEIEKRRYSGCKAVSEEAVNGTPTIRYELHYEMSEGDRRYLNRRGLDIRDPIGYMWIGADGLMYKMLMPHIVMGRFEYGKFEAPK